MLDEAIAGSVAITVNGNVTLSSTNYVTDEARKAMLLLSGAGGFTITVPGVSKFYWVRNACSAAVIFSAGGTTASVPAGQLRAVITDGTDCYVSDDGASLAFVNATFLPLAGGTLTGALTLNAAPTADLHASTKKYVDDTAFNALAGTLPGQGGNSGKFLTTNGTIASWGTVDLSTYQPLDADLTAIAALTTSAAGREQLILVRRNVAFADSPVTAAYGDDISCDSSGGAITINLPAAVAGRAPIIIRAGASAATNNITLEPDGAETILGETNLEIDINHFSASFAAKAGAWV
jgi:hypothetical protein